MASDFWYEYFVKPIVSPEVQGYNLVNTAVLISILVIACAVIYFVLRKRIEFNSKFFTAMIPYILFGISMRVVMHQIEAGLLVLPGIVKTANPLELGFWFFTPGIWLLTFAFVVIGLLIGGVWRKHKMLDTRRVLAFGAVVCIAPLLFNLSKFNNWGAFLGAAVLIAVVAYGICWVINKFTKYKILADKLNLFIVGGQAIDGIASTIAITFFSFSEQHVFSNILIDIHPSLFVIVKLIIAVLICWSLDDYLKGLGKDAEKRKNLVGFVKVVIAILGFATGLASLFKLGII